MSEVETHSSEQVAVSAKVHKSVRKQLSDIAHERSTEDRIVCQSDVIRDALERFLTEEKNDE